jgi:transcription elongation factor SPT5
MTDSGDETRTYDERRKPATKPGFLRQFEENSARVSDASGDSEGGSYNSDSEEDSAEMKDFIAPSDEEEPQAPTLYRPDLEDDTIEGDHEKSRPSGGMKARRRDAESARQLAERFEQREDYLQTEVELLDDDEASLSTPINQWRIALTPNGSRHLFLLYVKAGKEADVVAALTFRYISQQRTEEPLSTIFSAFYTSEGSGQVFVEALTTSEVSKFRNNIKNMYFAKPPRMIPPDEMPGTMKVPVQKKRIAPGQFVRIKRELSPKTEAFKGDLAQIIHADTNSSRALVKLVPRIDYPQLQAMHGADEEADIRQSQINILKKGSSYRPPQAEFNEATIRELGGEVQTGKLPRKTPVVPENPRVLIWDDTAFVGTFAYKDYPIQHLETTEVNPTTAETQKFIDGLAITRFERGIRHFEAQMATSLGRTVLSAFDTGDLVRVRPGNEFSGMKVLVKAIEGEVVRVTPVDGPGAGQDLEMQKSQLERFFAEGNHVKIGSGDYAGETGEIVAVNEPDACADVVLDGHHVTVNVPLQNIQLTKEVSRAQRTIGVYSVLDAVRLADNSEGVIYRIENNSMHVLLTTGEARTVTLAVVARKSKPQYVNDRTGKAPISVGEKIKVEQGTHLMQGRVIHTTPHCVFIFTDEVHQNRGVMVVDPRDCQAPPSGERQGPVFTGRALSFERRHDMRGKVVRIVSGPFKGELADVKEADDSTLRVVLQSSGRRANLNRSDGDGRTWMFVSEPSGPFNPLGSRIRPEAQDAFPQIFGSKKRKPEPEPEPAPEAQAGVMDTGNPVPNYGLPAQPPGMGYRPNQQAWPYDIGHQYRPSGSPYSTTPQYSASPFATTSAYGQGYGQGASPYQNPRYG